MVLVHYAASLLQRGVLHAVREGCALFCREATMRQSWFLTLVEMVVSVTTTIIVIVISSISIIIIIVTINTTTITMLVVRCQTR